MTPNTALQRTRERSSDCSLPGLAPALRQADGRGGRRCQGRDRLAPHGCGHSSAAAGASNPVTRSQSPPSATPREQ
jgi:hypothetical protein